MARRSGPLGVELGRLALEAQIGGIIPLTHYEVTAGTAGSTLEQTKSIGFTYLPYLECSCNSSSGTWECPEQETIELPDPPETIDPDRPVAELTEVERETWCDWYSTLNHGGPGYPPVADRPVENGYAIGPACHLEVRYCNAAATVLSKAQCMANLSLSQCESPVSNLTGCAMDLFAQTCAPFRYSCLDYLESPNCKGTLVLSKEEVQVGAVAYCDVRVE